MLVVIIVLSVILSFLIVVVIGLVYIIKDINSELSSFRDKYEILHFIENSKSRELYLLSKEYKHLQKLYNKLKKGD